MIVKRIFQVVSIAILISGCSRYAYVQLSYPLAPESYLPDDVKSIAVVNRSLTREEDADGKLFEAITSGEVAGSDLLASDACIKGVFDGFMDFGQVELIIPQQVRMYGTGTRTLPEVLDWDQVAEICEREGSDALLVLETFDSNSDLLLAAATAQLSAIISTGSPKPVVPGQVKIHVLSYWRLYDPGRKEIIDQFQYDGYMNFDLRDGLPPPHALPETAYHSGQAYVRRFLPGSYVVKRELYKRTSGSASRQFKAGYRRTEVANWQGATDIWVDLTEHPKRKTAGRACVNMAVANEVLGDTDNALDWARKSYEFYNDKLGRSYSKILLKRKNLEAY